MEKSSNQNAHNSANSQLPNTGANNPNINANANPSKNANGVNSQAHSAPQSPKNDGLDRLNNSHPHGTNNMPEGNHPHASASKGNNLSQGLKNNSGAQNLNSAMDFMHDAANGSNPSQGEQNAAPQILDRAKQLGVNSSGFIKKNYNKANKALTKGITAGAKKMHFAVTPKVATIMSHTLLNSTIGLMLFGGMYLSENHVRYGADFVCNTQNDNGNVYNSDGDDSDATVTGGMSAFLKSGSQTRKVADIIVKTLSSKLKYNGYMIAGALGNVYAESGLDPNKLEDDGTNLGGRGLYQFTSDTKTAFIKYSHLSESKKWGLDTVKIQTLGILHVKESSEYLSEQKSAKTPSESAEIWMKKIEGIEDGSIQKRRDFAEYAYKKLNLSKYNDSADSSKWSVKNSGITGNGTEVTADDNAATAESLNDANCNDADNISSNDVEAGDAVSIAKKLKGYFHYSQDSTKHTIEVIMGISYKQAHGHVDQISKVKHNADVDCSSFVWLVYTLAGYKTPSSGSWYTGMMEKDAKGPHKWLKQVNTNDGKKGDAYVANRATGQGDDGHAAILAEDYHGPNTKVWQMCEGNTVNESTIKNAFSTFSKNDKNTTFTIMAPQK